MIDVGADYVVGWTRPRQKAHFLWIVVPFLFVVRLEIIPALSSSGVFI